MKIARATVCPLLLAAFLCGLQARPENNRQAGDAAKRFVQQFYSWYVPLALKGADNLQSSWSAALKDRGSDFSQSLKQALTEDENAQAKDSDYIVGLDFDPFLDAQDPCERYEVGPVTHRDGRYIARIYAVCSGKRNDKPNVLAELAPRNGSWVFVNFLYPGNGPDLLHTLNRLRRARQRTQH